VQRSCPKVELSAFTRCVEAHRVREARVRPKADRNEVQGRAE
jgi:hypothetical protein